MDFGEIDIDDIKTYKADNTKFQLYVYKFEILTEKERAIFIGKARCTSSAFGQHVRLLKKNKHYNEELLDFYNKNKNADIEFNFSLIARIECLETEAREKAKRLYNFYMSKFNGGLDNNNREILVMARKW